MPPTTVREPGYYTMSVTPLNAQGALDEGALREHLRFLASGGVGVYLASVGKGRGQAAVPRGDSPHLRDRRAGAQG